MAKMQKVVDIAISQEGYEEPHHDNCTKYGEEMDTIYQGFFNGKKNGYDWCCVFICWCFCTAYGMYEALKILNMPGHNLSAVVKYFYNYMKSGGMTGGEPKKGAVVFFQNSAGLSHVGICIDYDGEYVTTIEGNAGPGSYFVKRNKYRKGVTYIYGFGYPKYEAEPQPQPKPTYKRGEIYKVSCNELNVRTDAGTDKDIMFKLHRNDKVHCLKMQRDEYGRRWMRIDGWVCAQDKDGDIYII